MNKKKLFGVGGIIILIVVIVIVVALKLNTGNDKKTNSSNSKETEDIFRNININEDLSVDGTVKNLDNVRWNNANITQRDDRMSVMINLNNESATDEVPEKDLVVTLYNKNGKVIATQETHMEAISANYGYTFLDLDFEIDEIEIVYDIVIEAK